MAFQIHDQNREPNCHPIHPSVAVVIQIDLKPYQRLYLSYQHRDNMDDVLMQYHPSIA